MSSKNVLSILYVKSKRYAKIFFAAYQKFLVLDDLKKLKKLLPGPHDIIETGNVSPINNVPDHIIKPYYYYKPYEKLQQTSEFPVMKSKEEIRVMKKTCQLARKILNAAGNFIKPGITTDELDKYVHNLIIKNNAYPSPLLYCGFPKSICTSVNNIVVHGIPDDRKLINGDIISVDITVYQNGFHGDCAATFLVGQVNSEAKKLVSTTNNILMKAIDICKPGVPFNAIAERITCLATNNNYNVIPSVCGHGIGKNFHEPPEIVHSAYYLDGSSSVMIPGMTFTIEPAISEGSENISLWDDEWTTSTIDDSLCAQFEHTVLITDTGVEILTQ